MIALACQIVKLRDRVRIWKQTALTLENEAKSARADAVARTEADRKRIAGLTEELRLERETCTETADLLNRESEKVRGLSVQAQDQRSEIERLRDEAAKYKTERVHFYQREGIEAKKRMDVEEERDALRAEVAALQERLRASITRGDFAQMEVAALKSQNPKQHPVKVGEWVRRLVPSPACDVGTVAKVVHVDDDTSEIEYDVKRIDGQHGVWFAKNCEPCDPPATHDTPAGKESAESALETEPVTDEIKVGDVVEVFQKTGTCTFETDVGTRGTVLQMEDSCVDTAPLEGYLSPKGNHVALCDVRKVTT